ncbi:MAG: mechanosensitive ion channel family protein [Bradymonadaceae bacterium]|nr:mechanosensitive ion channel family protein [Lujinxingiaceae bacterium]
MDFINEQMRALVRGFGRVGGWEALAPYGIALLTMIAGYVAARSLARAMETLIRQTGSVHSALIARKLVFYVVFLVVFVVALANMGIKVSGLLAAAGIFTVAIGFAAQTSVSNVISGFFLFFDRPFSINDTVKIDTVLGTVISIDLLSTRIRTFDNLMVRIPNEGLLKATITNYTLYSVRRVEIQVSVAYGSDLKKTRETILGVMDRHRLILDEPAPAVIFDILADSGVNLLVRGWAERVDYITARSELTMGIHDALNAAEINIPFPQRVVHLEQVGPWRVESYVAKEELELEEEIVEPVSDDADEEIEEIDIQTDETMV